MSGATAGARRSAAAPIPPVAAEPESHPDALATLAAQANDREAALEIIFRDNYRELLRLATLLGAEADAEDIVSEAFVVLHRRWNRLNNEAAALPYLRSTVVNLVRMRIRHLRVVRRHVVELREEVVSPADTDVLLREDQRAVVTALRKLPGRQREALVLRYWADMKVNEIADAMGISAGAVKSHTARGMAALAEEFGDPR